MERRCVTALEHVFQRSLEEVFDAARAHVFHRLQAELEQRAAVGREDAAVVADGELAGIVSIGDAVERRVSELETESARMHDYIQTGRT